MKETETGQFTASGSYFEIDGDALSFGNVTGEASTGMNVATQTGFQIKVWLEPKI